MLFETEPFWEDNFDGESVDTSKWTFEVGRGKNGWGNNESQTYTNENTYVRDSVLSIYSQLDDGHYTSARLSTKGKGDFLYGRFELKAKCSSGRGLWNALWMMPSTNSYGGWPKSGEIDIMEQVGFQPERIVATVHTEEYNHKNRTSESASTVISSSMTYFHLYRLDWTPDFIKIFVDDDLLYCFTNDGTGNKKTWPFDQYFHIIINTAIGGSWGGQKGIDNSIFPIDAMQVDYVRVYRMLDREAVAKSNEISIRCRDILHTFGLPQPFDINIIKILAPDALIPSHTDKYICRLSDLTSVTRAHSIATVGDSIDFFIGNSREGWPDTRRIEAALKAIAAACSLFPAGKLFADWIVKLVSPLMTSDGHFVLTHGNGVR